MGFGIPNGAHREQALARSTGQRRTSGLSAAALAVFGLLAGLRALQRQRQSALGVLLGPGVPLLALFALRLLARGVRGRRW